MNAHNKQPVVIMDAADGVRNRNWKHIVQELDARGCAMIDALLAPHECDAMAALYPLEGRFRSRVVMGQHGFGSGESVIRFLTLSPRCGRPSIPS